MPEHSPPKRRPIFRRIPGDVSASTPSYAELAVTSNFTFLCGGSHPDELVTRAAELGHRAIAITDTNTLAGAVRAHVAAKQVGIPLVVGSRLVLTLEPDRPPLHVLVYPTDRAAYGRLCRLLTLGKQRANKGECHLTLHDLHDHHAGLLAVVMPPAVLDDCFLKILGDLKRWFDHDRLSLAATVRYHQHDASRLRQIATLARHTGVPMVATNDVLYHEPDRQPLQDVLACIREGCTLEQAGRRLAPNAERHLKPPEDMACLFADYPHALHRSVEIAERSAGFSLDQLCYEYPHEVVPPGQTPMEYLRQLSWAGAAWRYPTGVPPRVRDLLAHELSLIEELNYPHYFLTVHDIVRFANDRGILCQGRGAAANSAVCYCLGITAVDPERIDLLFERFVSRERHEPPDIDVDFEHERREEVIQHIYQRFGRDRAALTAEVITYRTRSAVRDVGKVLGLSVDALDRLARHLDGIGGESLSIERMQSLGFCPSDPTTRHLVELVCQIRGFPRHLSQHVGGFVLTNPRLDELVPIENAAMADRTVIEWDKDDIDALGMLKVDVLGLGMLTCLRKCFDLVRTHHGRDLTLAGVFRQEPREDPAVYQMISRADTVGVFQIESRAQMAMLPRLRPREFYDLVIQVAIVRPGPIQGDMVHPYLRRRDGREPVEYPDETAKQVLQKTLGVPLFQEQAMNLAIRCAGFSADEAEQLRKTIQAWRSRDGKILEFGRRIIDGMTGRGYPRDFAERCFEQIKGFGEYGFPESHAASFALLVYVSAWLKRHYPAAFTCALLNSQPMGFYAPAQLVRDAENHGIEVRPVDVNASRWDCTLEPASQGVADESSPALRLGMRIVDRLKARDAQRIVTAVQHRGPFHSIRALWQVSGVRTAALRRLAEADAFRSMRLDRQLALWHILRFRDTPAPLFEQAEQTAASDSPDPPDSPGSPDPLPSVYDFQQVLHDYASTGLSLKQHPIRLLRQRLDRMHVVPADDVADEAGFPHRTAVTVAGLVIIRQRPATAEGVIFITIEDETGQLNLIVRPAVYRRSRAAVRTATLLLARGHVERHGRVLHIQAETLQDLTAITADLSVFSRDFR